MNTDDLRRRKTTKTRWLIAGLLLLTLRLLPAQNQTTDLNLALPTENDALFHGSGAEFYQYITRDFQGVQSTPWQGGQYGFVRDPIETPGGVIYRRFHEGIDIRPLRRDSRGEPLDEVHAIADGKVVHVNSVPGSSNYGRYIVVEHRWDGASYYSLYAHLAAADVQPGQAVTQGTRLGLMGHTGTGLDRERAHVHLELNLLLSRHFESWYDNAVKDDPNRHGIYNGLNLIGIDIARLYLAQRKRPGLTIPQFLSDEVTFYKITLPATKGFDLAERYPWLLRQAPASPPPSWEVSFNRAGVPLAVAPGESVVAAPAVSFVEKSSGNYSNLTRGILTGTAEHVRLSASGERLMQLLIWTD
ncbi:MAG TPA: M23 family metallopeptidase [Chthoniobacterales bacterium]|nr:M23 family metallopeptidase [Chthoniobacterales bacterium]